jgi:hypothetical protein
VGFRKFHDRVEPMRRKAPVAAYGRRSGQRRHSGSGGPGPVDPFPAGASQPLRAPGQSV